MTWQLLPAMTRRLYSPIGFRLVDAFTSFAPRYPVYADLEFQDGSGRWQAVQGDREAPRYPKVTPSGIFSFPELGRSAQVALEPVLRHRVRFRSDFYRPAYLRNADGVEFDVRPYDDANPPAVIPTHPQTELLMPNVRYGYPSHIRVVRGLVEDAGGAPVANVEVSAGTTEMVLTDERGAFSLPLRWPALSVSVPVDAMDHRTGRTDSILVSLPGDLAHSHTFTIT